MRQVDFYVDGENLGSAPIGGVLGLVVVLATTGASAGNRYTQQV